MDLIERLCRAKESWIAFRALQDLAGKHPDDPAVREARAAMEADPDLLALRKEIAGWPGTVLSSHRSANQTFHRMVFLADIGFTEDDPLVAAGLRSLRESRDEQGFFTLPVHREKEETSGNPERRGWALCDAPILLYAMAKMGRDGLAEARQGALRVVSFAQDFGISCAVSPVFGGFRGPGKKSEPCPYATLVALKLWQLFPDLSAAPAARAAREALLSLWEHSRESHPYMFFMGTDFRKLTAPFVWYDILHVAEVLSHDSRVRKDSRFMEMMAVIRAKADSEGLYAPEISARAWKGWEFGSVGVPSLWLTWAIARIERRLRQPPEGETRG